MRRLFLPDLLYAEGRAGQGEGLLVDEGGAVVARAKAAEAPDAEVVRMHGRALMPGLANAHSHCFQRLFRARAENRAAGGDTFWTWREQMYRAAGFLSPEDVFDVARAVFLEMVASGITAVGEFHYLHNDRDGRPYSDPNELSHAVIRAAESVGVRICLLRTAYLRAGFQREPHAGQRRFYETGDVFLRNIERLLRDTEGKPGVSVGAAPHSIRAVPLTILKEIADFSGRRDLPLHMHVSEQPAENEACIAEYGQTPISLLAEHRVLGERTTLVHAIHLTAGEFAQVAVARSTICSCPTTERNLGDGIFSADVAARLDIPVAFGTDSQAQIDLLEDARQTEYHLRLAQQERGVLDSVKAVPIGDRLLASATKSGYRSLGLKGGSLAKGEPADFFTVDLNDLALLGADVDSLADQVVFAAGRAAIRDVAIAGRLVLAGGTHALQDEICSRYVNVQQRFLHQEVK